MDSDAAAYIAAVESVQSAHLFDHVKSAIDAFVIGCKEDASPVGGVSNWDAIKACCFLAGPSTFAASLVPLKGPAPTPTAFTWQRYSPSKGLKGDGSTMWLNINRAGNADPQDNCHLMIYITEANSIISAGLAGQGSGGTTSQRSLWFNGAKANSVAIFGENGYPTGAVGVSRHNSSGFQSLWIGGHQTFSAPSAAPSANNIAIFSRNVSGSVPSNMRCSFYSAGESVDLVKMRNRIATYMQSIAGDSGSAAPPHLIAPSLSHGVIG